MRFSAPPASGCPSPIPAAAARVPAPRQRRCTISWVTSGRAVRIATLRILRQCPQADIHRLLPGSTSRQCDGVVIPTPAASLHRPDEGGCSTTAICRTPVSRQTPPTYGPGPACRRGTSSVCGPVFIREPNPPAAINTAYFILAEQIVNPWSLMILAHRAGVYGGAPIQASARLSCHHRTPHGAGPHPMDSAARYRFWQACPASRTDTGAPLPIAGVHPLTPPSEYRRPPGYRSYPSRTRPVIDDPPARSTASSAPNAVQPAQGLDPVAGT